MLPDVTIECFRPQDVKNRTFFEEVGKVFWHSKAIFHGRFGPTNDLNNKVTKKTYYRPFPHEWAVFRRVYRKNRLHAKRNRSSSSPSEFPSSSTFVVCFDSRRECKSDSSKALKSMTLRLFLVTRRIWKNDNIGLFIRNDHFIKLPEVSL